MTKKKMRKEHIQGGCNGERKLLLVQQKRQETTVKLVESNRSEKVTPRHAVQSLCPYDGDACVCKPAKLQFTSSLRLGFQSVLP